MNLDEWNLGGGSGGGAGNDDDGNKLESASSTYQITGNQVVLLSREPVPPPVPPKQSGPSRIVILAAGKVPSFNEGNVDIRGSKGVRITAGPPAVPKVSPAVSLETTDGVEIAVPATQSIKLECGDPSLPASQKIELTPGQVLIDGGAGKIIIKSTTEITLAVGLSSITISQEGITIAVGLNSVSISEEKGITIMGGTTPVKIMPEAIAAIIPPPL
jgi:hypothetical protein